MFGLLAGIEANAGTVSLYGSNNCAGTVSGDGVSIGYSTITTFRIGTCTDGELYAGISGVADPCVDRIPLVRSKMAITQTETQSTTSVTLVREAPPGGACTHHTLLSFSAVYTTEAERAAPSQAARCLHLIKLGVVGSMRVYNSAGSTTVVCGDRKL